MEESDDEPPFGPGWEINNECLFHATGNCHYEVARELASRNHTNIFLAVQSLCPYDHTFLKAGTPHTVCDA
jgi:hypothetical protein